MAVFALMILSTITMGQQKGKKKEEEKPPTQKEMDEMMKEMQKAMGEISAEDKKAMDSMGIKLPDANSMKKNMSGVTDAQLKKAWEDENRIVPARDATRIATISASPLTASSVSAFITNQHNFTVTRLLPASKTLGEKLYAQFKAKGLNSAVIGNNAAGLWIMGRIQPALYIMGRACTEDVSNSDNLNNYASMLSMCGAEQKAIPVLNYLNSKFPLNSTILNNLGQAWFGLGEISKAEKYFESVIKIYPYHPQANLTKSLIAESKGNKAEAIVLVRNSLQHSYSKEKEDRLKKLGHNLTSKDFSLPGKPKADPLNLGGFNTPPFPKTVEACIALKPVWLEYRQMLDERIGRLKKQYDAANKLANDMQEKRLKENIAMVNASVAEGALQGTLNIVPMHISEASHHQKEVTDEFNRKLEVYGKKAASLLTGRLVQLKTNYDKEIEELQKKDAEQSGEGKPNKDFCPLFREVSDKFLSAYNSEKELIFKEWMSILKPFLNDLTYWQMYSEWPERYETYKLAAMIKWLEELRVNAPHSFESITQYKCQPPKPVKGGPLANFDDVACKYHSEIKLIFGTMRSDCSRFTTEIDLGFIKGGLKQDMDKESFADQFMSCNVEFGAKVGRDVRLGPVTVEASAGARVGFEIDRSGVKDVYVVGGVKAGVGSNIISGASEALGTPASTMGQGVNDVSLDGGIEGRISIISGRGSIYGTGIFEK
jgi:tetratricopeptide (TPR) repeat protein